jgi:hypothetical protein
VIVAHEGIALSPGAAGFGEFIGHDFDGTRG